MKVLITDANQRSALAATRSLGQKGIYVIAADESKSTLSSVSKYCSEYFIYPSPYDYPQGFVNTIKAEVRKRKIDILLPMTEVTTYLILKNRGQLEQYTRIPFPDFEAFDFLSDKFKLFKFAESLDIPIPKTQFIENLNELEQIIDSLEFPVVLKPPRSRMLVNGRWLSTPVHYAHTPEELIKICERNLKLIQINQPGGHEKPNEPNQLIFPLLIQKRIVGPGCGIFVIFDEGQPKQFFAHRRLREKPPSGGVSVLRESIPVDPKMKEIASKILSYLDWHGVAMVEFKIDKMTQIPYLMEVNGRFWGSLQLAIDAGVDFPYLLYKLAISEALYKLDTYKMGIKTRWLLGDVDYLYMRLFKNGLNLPPDYPSRLKCFLEFLKFYDKGTKYEIASLSDPKPFLCELKQYIRGVLRSRS